MTDIPTLAISIRQPWAWAIIHMGKDIENRAPRAASNMKNGIGQRVAIHAAKTLLRIDYERAAKFMAAIPFPGAIVPPAPLDLPRGCLIGEVTITEIVRKSTSPWWMGPRGLVLADPVAYPAPLITEGALGLFEWRKQKPRRREPKIARWMEQWGRLEQMIVFATAEPQKILWSEQGDFNDWSPK